METKRFLIDFGNNDYNKMVKAFGYALLGAYGSRYGFNQPAPELTKQAILEHFYTMLKSLYTITDKWPIDERFEAYAIRRMEKETALYINDDVDKAVFENIESYEGSEFIVDFVNNSVYTSVEYYHNTSLYWSKNS